MKNCEPLIVPALTEAFEAGIRVESDEGACRVTVPFERADNDAITLWIEKGDNGYIISDKGDTYGMLYLSNINLDQPRRRKRLNSTQKRYNLEKAKYEVRLTASESELGQRLLDAIQAVQSISNLVLTRRQYTQSDFYDEVGTYLTEINMGYERNIPVSGKAEDHRVDFSIMTSTPTYMEAIHAENVSTAHSMAQRTAYKWIDIGKRDLNIRLVSVLDDESGEYDGNTESVLEEYSDAYVRWSSRGDLQQILTG